METITSRIDAVTEIPPEYRNPVCPPPKSIKWELVGNACNYACSYCAIERGKKQLMDLELFKRASKEALDFGVEECGLFFVGESCLEPKLLVDALKWAKRIGYPYVFLTTNGSLCNPLLSGELMSHGLDSLKFSINASGPAQFKQLMRVKPKLFEDALNNLRAAHTQRNAMGYKTRIYASSIEMFDGDANKEEMDALLKERVLPFVDQHYTLPCFESMQIKNSDRNAALGIKVTAGNPGRAGNMRNPADGCWSVFREGHVRANGGVSACCFASDGTFDMGGLTEQSFGAAWNSKPFQALRAAHLSGKGVRGTVCESCIHGTKAISFV